MGFLRSKSSPAPIPQMKKVKPMVKKVADTTQPLDMGKGSKKTGRDGTILTSVMGVEEPATIGTKTLLGGGMY
tara:strand:- start:414 stop:632 length:219 start_codon:yes stop_codon:yes gene_type:complete